jgi:excinuclease ABC subunit B
MPAFKIHAPYRPSGDQPKAIDQLVRGLEEGLPRQVLLGVTGSGKTFTMAGVIERTQRPALVIAHNKTLAAQLCNEFRELFPENAVEYFVSYYDYSSRGLHFHPQNVQREGVRTSTRKSTGCDTRHGALLERRTTSWWPACRVIYSLGDPREYMRWVVAAAWGMVRDRDEIIARWWICSMTATI